MINLVLINAWAPCKHSQCKINALNIILSLKLWLRHEKQAFDVSHEMLKKNCQLAKVQIKQLNTCMFSLLSRHTEWTGALCPSKVYSLLPVTAFHSPHLHKNEFSQKQSNVVIIQRICQVNLNSFVLSTSYDAKLSVSMWKGKIINLTTWVSI